MKTKTTSRILLAAIAASMTISASLETAEARTPIIPTRQPIQNSNQGQINRLNYLIGQTQMMINRAKSQVAYWQQGIARIQRAGYSTPYSSYQRNVDMLNGQINGLNARLSQLVSQRNALVSAGARGGGGYNTGWAGNTQGVRVNTSRPLTPSQLAGLRIGFRSR